MTVAPTSSLRERQAQQVRTAIVEAVIDELATKAADDVSMAEIADSAGISLRTLYRYFPDRPALLHAAGEHLYASLDVPFEISGPDQISASLLAAAARLSARPHLTRALVQTTAGRTARSALRARRVAAIEAALGPITDRLDADTRRWANAVIAHLCSAASWVLLADDSGLDDTDAQHAVAWAIDRIVASLREPGASERPNPDTSTADAEEMS